MKFETSGEGKSNGNTICSQSDVTLVLNVEPFDISKPLEWNDYVEFVELNFAANNIDTLSDAQQVVKFLATAGRSIFELVRCLVAPASFRDFSLAEIKALLAKHFLPSDNVLLSTHTFYWRKKRPDESHLEYATVLHKLAVDCNFGAYEDRALCDQFICGLDNPEVRDRVIRSEKDLSFKEAVTIAAAADTSTNEPMAENMLRFEVTNGSSSAAKTTSTTSGATVVTERAGTAINPCKSCGEKHERVKCPFRTSVCEFCKVSGHVMAVCMRRKKTLMVTKPKIKAKTRSLTRAAKYAKRRALREHLKSKAAKVSATSSSRLQSQAEISPTAK